MLANQKMLVLCTYPLSVRKAGEVFDVAQAHEFAIAKRHGHWEMLETPELKQTKNELAALRKGLEQRVELRTRELAAANAALKEQQAKLKEAQRLANIGYWERDLTIDRLTPAEESSRIFGLPPGHPRSQAELQEVMYPDDRQLQIRALAEALEKRRPYDQQYRIVRPDGQLRFVHVWGEICYDQSGRALRMVGTVQDITERKRAEEAVRESQQLLQLVLATLPVGVAVTDRAGDIVLANAASKRIWGDFMIASGPERWAKSKGFWHNSGERIAPANWASVRALRTGQTSLNELIDIESFDGQQKTILNSAAPIHNAEGLIVGAVIVNEDVTERVRAEAELTRVARWTIMGELTASIAHEINQPLVGVVTNANACLQWLAAGKPNLGEARKAVKRIARDGKRAGDVIARIRALLQKGEPVREPLNLNQIIRSTVSLLRSELQRKTVALRIELAPELPRVAGDRVQLEQVIMNLILNAVDALNEVTGRPRVLRIRTARAKRRLVRVEIRDTGVGIGPTQARRLFEPFFTTKPNGLGLGLAISRSIVEAHGGRLWATPNRGPGMTFQFTLPIQNGGS